MRKFLSTFLVAFLLLAIPIYADSVTYDTPDITFTMPASDVTIETDAEANTDTPYKAEHYKQKLNATSDTALSQFVIADTDEYTGTTDTQAEPATKTYEGFTTPATQKVNIDGDGSRVVKYLYLRNDYTLTLKAGTGIAKTNNAGSHEYQENVSISANVKPGYTFEKWSGDFESTSNSTSITMPASNVTMTASATPNTNTPYKVEHYQQNIDAVTDTDITEFTLVDTDNYTGTTDTKVTPPAKTYEGFMEPVVPEANINGDGSTVIKILYLRHKYNINMTVGTGISSVDGAIPTRYDKAVNLKANVKPGYTFEKWSGYFTKTDNPYTFNMPDTDIDLTVSATPNTDTPYKVEHYKQNLDAAADDYTNGYTLTDTDNYKGTTDTEVTPAVKTYVGFTAPETQTVNIDGNGLRVVKYYYTRNHYDVKLSTSTGVASVSGGGDDLQYDDDLNISAVIKPGYTFVEWTGSATYNDNPHVFKVPARDLDLTATASPNTDTKYKVEHYQQNIGAAADDYEHGYTLIDTDNLEGTTDTEVTPEFKDYTGFTAPEAQTVNIDGDNSRVVKYYYTRNKYKYTIKIHEQNIDDDDFTVVDTQEYEDEFDKSLTPEVIDREGFTSPDAQTFKVPANNNYVVNYKFTRNTYDYKVEHYQQNIGASADDYESGYTLTDTDNLSAKFDKEITPARKSYTGFTAPTAITFNVEANNDKVVKYYYTRNKYKYKVEIYEQNIDDDDYTIVDTQEFEAEFDDTISPEVVDREGFTSPASQTIHIPANDSTVIAYKFNRNVYNYTVKHYQQNLGADADDHENGYTLTDTDNLSAKYDKEITPARKTYTGFTAPEAITFNVEANNDKVINYYYKRNKYDYKVKIYEQNIEDDEFTLVDTQEYKAEFDASVTPEVVDREGFTSPAAQTFTVPAHNNTIIEYKFTRNSYKYTVEHYKQNIDDDDYTLADTEEFTEKYQAEVTPYTMGYDGFTIPDNESVTVPANNNLVVKYYYDRIVYEVTLSGVKGIKSVSGEGSYRYEKTVTIKAELLPGYSFVHWEGTLDSDKINYTFTMPSKDVTDKAIASPNTDTPYTVEHYLQKLDKDGEDLENDYTLKDTDHLKGTTDTSVTPDTKTYANYITPPKQTVNVDGDGSRVVKYYYTAYVPKFGELSTKNITITQEKKYDVSIDGTNVDTYQWEYSLDGTTWTAFDKNVTIINGTAFTGTQTNSLSLKSATPEFSMGKEFYLHCIGTSITDRTVTSPKVTLNYDHSFDPKIDKIDKNTYTLVNYIENSIAVSGKNIIDWAWEYSTDGKTWSSFTQSPVTMNGTEFSHILSNVISIKPSNSDFNNGNAYYVRCKAISWLTTQATPAIKVQYGTTFLSPNNIMTKWDSGEDFNGALRPTNNPMTLTAINTGNLYNKPSISYSWYKDDKLLTTKKGSEEGYQYKLKGVSDSENGSYYCVLNDDNGYSITMPTLNLYAWDTTPPNVEVTFDPPIGEVAATRRVIITVTDENPNPRDIYFGTDPIALVGGKYEYSDEIFTSQNTYTITQPGDYYIYARDITDNITQYKSSKKGAAQGAFTFVWADFDTRAPQISGYSLSPGGTYTINTTDNVKRTDEFGNVLYDENGEPLYDAVTVPIEQRYVKLSVTATDDNGGTIWYRLEKDGILSDPLNADGNHAYNYADGWTTDSNFDYISESGEYIVYTRDIAGNTSSRKIYIDVDFYNGNKSSGEDDFINTFQPTIIVAPLTWTKDPVEVRLVIGDMSLNPVASINNGGSWSTPNNGTCTWSIPYSGVYQITIKDMYGNTYTSGDIIIDNIDSDAPELQAQLGDNETIHITAMDAVGSAVSVKSGLDQLSYTFVPVAQSESKGQENIVLKTFADNADDGEADLYASQRGIYKFYVTDRAGNSTAQQQDNCVLDLTEIVPDNDLFQGTDETIADKIASCVLKDPEGFTSGDVTLIFAPPSNHGFADQFISWDKGETWTNSYRFTVDTNGEYYVYIKDIYGNIYKSNPITVDNIDKQRPLLAASTSKGSLIIKAADSISGIREVNIKGGDFKQTTLLEKCEEFKETVDILMERPSGGKYIIRAIDNANNLQVATIKISDDPKEDSKATEVDSTSLTKTDTDEESLHDIFGDLLSRINISTTDWTNQGVTLTYSPVTYDDLADRPYSWNMGESFSNDTQFVADKNGEYRLYIKTKYGDLYASDPIKITNIDTDAPSLFVTQDGGDLLAKAADNLSGIAKLTLSDGTTENYPYKTSVIDFVQKILETGTMSVTVYDVAGNTTTEDVDVIQAITALNSGTFFDSVFKSEDGSLLSNVTETFADTALGRFFGVKKLTKQDKDTGGFYVDNTTIASPNSDTTDLNNQVVVAKRKVNLAIPVGTGLALLLILFLLFRKKDDEDEEEVEDSE